MKIFKDEPVIDSNGMFVYPPAPDALERESAENTAYTYNGICLPPLPWERTY